MHIWNTIIEIVQYEIITVFTPDESKKIHEWMDGWMDEWWMIEEIKKVMDGWNTWTSRRQTEEYE